MVCGPVCGMWAYVWGGSEHVVLCVCGGGGGGGLCVACGPVCVGGGGSV